MSYTDNLHGLDSASPKRVTRRDEGSLAISYPTDTFLPDGTPVKFDSSGKLVAAVNSMAIGIIAVPKGQSMNQTVAEGRATVQVYGLAEQTGKATAAIAVGDELKFAGVESGTNVLTFTKASSGDIVVGIATTAAAANAVLSKVVMLYTPYKKA